MFVKHERRIMHIYKISVFSECGTYFEAYLQQLTVFAKSKEEALSIYDKWSSDNYSFIREPKISDIDELSFICGEGIVVDGGGVVDFVIDSDY